MSAKDSNSAFYEVLNPATQEMISCHCTQDTMALNMERDRVRRFCKTLNRLPQDLLLENWSCDWEEWKQIYDYIIGPEFYDLSPMDMKMKCIYGLQPPIRPIAYRKDTNDHAYILKAGTKYYYWVPDFEMLMQLDGTFTDEDVLRRWVPTWPSLKKDTAELEPDYNGIETRIELEMLQRLLALARQATAARGSTST
jgi:hypothetical protein